MERFPTLFVHLSGRNPSAEISSVQLKEAWKETSITETKFLIIVMQWSMEYD